jgi:type IV pilus assembly protein PilY1
MAAPTDLADQPIFSTNAVPGNLALALSVEFPTGVSVANRGGYSTAANVLGYFDPGKCYRYVYSAVEAERHFAPAGKTATRTCADDQTWSGSFLNWATMQTIDPFRWALTGGYRSKDTTTETFIEKAWASGQGGTGNFPNRTLAQAAVPGATPFGGGGDLRMRIQGLGNKMRFTWTGSVDSAPVAYDPAVPVDVATVYEVSIRVKVCDTSAASGGVESNCVQYPNGNWKPEGLIQQYSNQIRYSAFGYLNDGSVTRDGGVLRARQKFVGPQVPRPGLTPIANPQREWDPQTGVFVANPDTADAANALGIIVNNSGVANYLNKFGRDAQSYKTYDPVSELYYAAVRYFKNQGNVPAWTAGNGANAATLATYVDGFPVITDWDDPIQYSCQKNYVLGIGDANSHADKNLPGSVSNANEPAKPAQVTADATVNVITATDKVGALEGITDLGTRYNYPDCCTTNSAYIAGLAYDSHTKDIRPDTEGAKSVGKQTIATYWLDVLESGYETNNQYYLAAKYGGFSVPDNFDPYARTAPLDPAWWHTNGDALNATNRRPDNYFTAARPDQMIAGLTSAFEKIAADLRATSSAISTAQPQLTENGGVNFATSFDAGNWTGDLVASVLKFDALGDSVTEVKWSARSTLATQLGNGGWDQRRRVVSYAGGVGVPFRINSISAGQKVLLNTSYGADDDSPEYLNYLRGDQSHEAGSTAVTDPKGYRPRAYLLGDIDSKSLVVGIPTEPWSDAFNKGYSAFQKANANRTPVVYVGANDGMLHAFNGTVDQAASGAEIFAYVPSALYAGPSSPSTPHLDGLALLGNPTTFAHRYFVNAAPLVASVDFKKTVGATAGDPDWRSILVGGLGKGGRSYYAIDVTDPSTMTSEVAVAGKVLWEFSDSRLGFSYGRPQVFKTAKYGWVVAFASGYNNVDGRGYLFLVNPRTGVLLEVIGTGQGSTTNPAGLAQINASVPEFTDGTADAVYVGDLLGNLWRFDLTEDSAAAYPAPLLLARLTTQEGVAQPVTAPPQIWVHKDTKARYVMVGTGRLLGNSDVASGQRQAFYAIIDGTGNKFNTVDTLPAGVDFPIERDELHPLQEAQLLSGFTTETDRPMGWFLDLNVSAGGIGERIYLEASAILGKVAFPTLLPNGDVCAGGGSSRVFGLDFATGKTILVQNGQPVPYFTSNVAVTDAVFLSSGGKPKLVIGTSDGKVTTVGTNFTEEKRVRRLNWREIPSAQ